MTERRIPMADALVEIDIPTGTGHAAYTVTRRIVTMRDHGDGRYTCLLSDPDRPMDGLSTMTVAPAEGGGWIGVQPPVSVDGAVHVAQSVLAGVTLHRSVTEQMRLLSEAVLLLTGQQRIAGRPVATRMPGGGR